MSAKTNKKFASHRKLFLVGKDAPFSFVEAYKSLRTNLEFLSTTICRTIPALLLVSLALEMVFS